MNRMQQVTGHQPVEPDHGPEKGPEPGPGKEPIGGVPHRKHHDPEDPGFADED